jgi:hypothetical protein
MAKENGGVIGVLNTPSTSSAKGVWALQDQYEAKRNNNWPLTPFVSSNSARFNSGSTDYLSRTPSTTTDRQKWTISFWLKRSNISVNAPIISQGSTTGAKAIINFGAGDRLALIFDSAAGGDFRTDMLFRDVSAWYNIVVACDTTQATASNRVKTYVNGVQQSYSTEVQPSQNYNTQFNTNTILTIGTESDVATTYLNGYLSEFYLIDGQQLTPTSFGASNASGVWYPIPYAGSYGTNGFNLKFGNSASLGTDSSPNGNNFTVNNLTSVDQSTDSMLNNFCTLNFLSKASDITLSNGNLTATRSTASFSSVMSTIGVSTGKWYWEAKVVSLGIINFGVTKTKQDGTTHSSVDAGRVMYSSNGNVYDEGFSNTPYNTGVTFTTNDIIGLALDLINGTLAFYKNGTLVYTYSNAGLTTNEMTPANGLYSAVGDMNFGSPPFTIVSGNADGAGYGNFEYTVPSGYYSLCTANLNTYG